MNRIFLDTNILLDYGQERKEFLYAKAIMELGERREIELFASYLSYANMGYILRKYPKDEIWSLIKDMREGILFSTRTADSWTWLYRMCLLRITRICFNSNVPYRASVMPLLQTTKMILWNFQLCRCLHLRNFFSTFSDVNRH